MLNFWEMNNGDATTDWTENMKKFYDPATYTEATDNYFKNFTNMYNTNQNDTWDKVMTNSWGKMFSQSSFKPEDQMALFNKMMNTQETYTHLFNFWNSLNKQTSFDSNDSFMNFYSQNKTSYMDMISNLAKSFTFGESAPMMDQSLELYKSYISLFEKVNMPWANSSTDLQEIYKKMLSGKPDALKEYYELMDTLYKNSMSQVLNTSGLGIYKDNIEAQMQGLDSYIQYNNSYNELMAMVYGSMNTSMEKIMQNYTTTIKENKQPKTFKEFYELWLSINETDLVDLFATEEFSKVYNALAEKYCDFKIKFDKLAGMYLKVLPLPSKEDMDSLYETVYNQRKDIKNLKKESASVKTMSDELASLRKEIEMLKKELTVKGAK